MERTSLPESDRLVTPPFLRGNATRQPFAQPAVFVYQWDVNDAPPSPGQPIWPTRPWWRDDGQGVVAPACPKCGGKLRPDDAGEHRHPGSARPPWNAGWDGRCAACGHDFTVMVAQRTHFQAHRTVRIRPAEQFHQTFTDEGTVFCGVEIEVEDAPHPGNEPETSRVFLSMGELMALTQALQDPAHPWLAQQDWTCDWT